MTISYITNFKVNPFCKKLESAQQKAALVITAAIQGTSCDKIIQKLRLQSLN